MLIRKARVVYYSLWLFLRSFGRLKVFLDNPYILSGINKFNFARNVRIEKDAWLVAHSDSKGISIGRNTKIHRQAHFDSSVEIVIESNVLIAERVYIADNTHDYVDTQIPIKDQSIRCLNRVQIGEGTWIGMDAKIVGASIGVNCVVAANSFVNRDVPDYTVVAGSPARVIRYYCVKSRKWIKIKKEV